MMSYFVHFAKGPKWHRYLLVLLLTLVSASSAQVSRSVKFQKSELELKSAKTEDNGEEFQKLKLKDLFNTGEPGMPEIPVKNVKLIVPSGMDVSDISITASGKESIQLPKKIYPVQYPIPTSINYTHRIAKADSVIYNSDGPYPSELVKVVEEGYFDGNHIVTLAVYPIQYFPKSDKIIFYSDINFSLSFKSGKIRQDNGGIKSKKNQDMYDKMLAAIVDNPEDIMKYQVKPQVFESNNQINSLQGMNLSIQSTTEIPNFYEYVIITTNDLVPGFDEFIKWKKKKGLDIGVVTIDQILANYSGDLTSSLYDDAGKLRQYLKEAHNTKGTVYALLAGNRDVIPYRYGSGHLDAMNHLPTFNDADHIPSDLYFSDFDGNWNSDGDPSLGEELSNGTQTGDQVDYLPEIFVGRILCRNVDEVISWANKVIEYERNPFQGNYDLLLKCLWTQSDEMQEIGDAQSVAPTIPFAHTYIEESPITDPDHPTFPTGPDVINKINEGFGFYNIYNHGEFHDYVVRWPGTHNLSGDKATYCSAIYGKHTDEQKDYNKPTAGFLDNITSQNKSTIIYSVACGVAHYDGIDYNLYRCVGDAYTTLNESGGPAFLGNTRDGYIGLSSSLHYAFANKLFAGIYNIGRAEAYSKPGCGSISMKHYLVLSHNLFGDPEMPVWTARPEIFSSLTVQDNISSITVNTGITNVEICVSSIDNGTSFHQNVALTNGPTSYTFSLPNIPGDRPPYYITVTKKNYIPYVAITKGTLPSNDTWSGQLIVLGNITIPAGKSLTVKPDANLTFRNSSSIINNGTLTIAGTATNKVRMDFVSPASGNGVKFYYGSSGSISYANIKNAYYGIYSYNSSPRLSSNTFTGNTYGVYCENYASPLLTGNTISGSSIGVECIYNGSPSLTVTTYGTGNNVITQNGYGIDAYRGGSPFIGGVYSGNNSIFGNTNYNLCAEYSGTIYAYHTWWGIYPVSSPDLAKIYSYQASVDYTQPLSSDPNAGRPLSKVIYAENGSNQGQSSSGTEDVLLQGLSLQAEGKYNEAISSYVNVIKNNMKAPKATLALSKLSECYQLTGRNDFIDYLNSSIRPNLSKEDEISITTLELENFWLTIQGKYDQVIKNIGKIKSDYPDKKEPYKYALFNEGFTYYAFLKDSSKAKDAFSKLQKLYPEDHLVVEAKLLLGENPGTLPAPKLMPGNAVIEENEAITGKPADFELFGNFPNPFNPSTVIRYDLPTSSKVELKIYDILGKEVMTLVNGIQEAGRYNASFNASVLPSGIYIYSLKAHSLENGKSFEKNSKMLYLK